MSWKITIDGLTSVIHTEAIALRTVIDAVRMSKLVTCEKVPDPQVEKTNN